MVKLPTHGKVVWWLAITGGLTYFLWQRLPDLLRGNAAAGDLVVFGVWVALLLSPLFTEVSLLGVTLKSEIEELKDSISMQISDFKSEVRTYVGVNTTVSPQFHLAGPTVPDTELPDLEARVKKAVEEALDGVSLHPSLPSEGIEVPANVALLLKSRYALEQQMRFIAMDLGLRGVSKNSHGFPSGEVFRILSEMGKLPYTVADAIVEVRRICNAGLHGEELSESQVKFVRDTTPELVTALNAIRQSAEFQQLANDQLHRNWTSRFS